MAYSFSIRNDYLVLEFFGNCKSEEIRDARFIFLHCLRENAVDKVLFDFSSVGDVVFDSFDTALTDFLDNNDKSLSEYSVNIVTLADKKEIIDRVNEFKNAFEGADRYLRTCSSFEEAEKILQ